MTKTLTFLLILGTLCGCDDNYNVPLEYKKHNWHAGINNERAMVINLSRIAEQLEILNKHIEEIKVGGEND